MIWIVVIFYRLPAEWLALLLYQVQIPDMPTNERALYWIITVALAVSTFKLYRDNQELQRERVALLEKVLTANQEHKAAILDNTEIIEVLAGKLERGRARNERTKKTP